MNKLPAILMALAISLGLATSAGAAGRTPAKPAPSHSRISILRDLNTDSLVVDLDFNYDTGITFADGGVPTNIRLQVSALSCSVPVPAESVNMFYDVHIGTGHAAGLSEMGISCGSNGNYAYFASHLGVSCGAGFAGFASGGVYPGCRSAPGYLPLTQQDSLVLWHPTVLGNPPPWEVDVVDDTGQTHVMGTINSTALETFWPRFVLEEAWSPALHVSDPGYPMYAIAEATLSETVLGGPVYQPWPSGENLDPLVWAPNKAQPQSLIGSIICPNPYEFGVEDPYANPRQIIMGSTPLTIGGLSVPFPFCSLNPLW